DLPARRAPHDRDGRHGYSHRDLHDHGRHVASAGSTAPPNGQLELAEARATKGHALVEISIARFGAATARTRVAGFGGTIACLATTTIGITTAGAIGAGFTTAGVTTGSRGGATDFGIGAACSDALGGAS